MGMNFKERLATLLDPDEMKIVKTAYDQVGTIAILTIPDLLMFKSKIIGKALLDSVSTIKTVVCKSGMHEGEFRTQPLKFLAGVDTKEADYKESGCRIKVNVETVYFSPRLSTERERIMEKIKPDEDVLVMFSGCGIYPIIFSKKTKAHHLVGIEINPEGHRYGLENIKLNKIKNVDLYCGDVHAIAPTLNENFDRIVMPLPASADQFLGDAFALSKKGTIIHFYAFESEETMPKKTKAIVRKYAQEHGIKVTFPSWAKCGPNKPKWYRICVDAKIS